MYLYANIDGVNKFVRKLTKDHKDNRVFQKKKERERISPIFVTSVVFFLEFFAIHFNLKLAIFL